MRKKLTKTEELSNLYLFATLFDLLGQASIKTTVSKGFKKVSNFGEALALVHAELSEALEGIREGNPPDKHLPEFTAAEVELADAVIRIMGMSAARKWKVGKALVAKLEYNRSRPRKHGGKLF